MRFKFVLALVLSLVSIDVISQISFHNLYGDTGIENILSVKLASDSSGYLLLGSSDSYGNGFIDILFAKTDLSGIVIWSQVFGGQYDEVGVVILEHSSNGYYLVGSSFSSDTSEHETYIYRVDSIGNLMWIQGYSGIGSGIVADAVLLGNGDIAIVGSTPVYGAGLYDIYLMRIDDVGNLLWYKTYGGANYEFASSLVIDGNGGFIIGGSTRSFGQGSGDGLLIRTDSAGTVQWSKTLGGFWDDKVNGIIRTSDGNYAISGKFHLGSIYIKMDNSGNVLEKKMYNGIVNDVLHEMVETADGNFYIIGRNEYNLWLIKITPVGDTLWTGNFGVFGPYEYPQGLTLVENDAILLYGQSNNEDGCIIKLDSAGNAGCYASPSGTIPIDTNVVLSSESIPGVSQSMFPITTMITNYPASVLTNVLCVVSSNLTVFVTSTDVSCYGDSDAVASATPIGGISPFDYAWSNGDSSQNITGLSAGNYSVTVTDGNSDTASYIFVITEPADITYNFIVTNATCGNSDGTIVAGPTWNAFQWADFGLTDSIPFVSAGVYLVTVTDIFSGCSKVDSAIVNNDNGVVVDSLLSSDASCLGCCDGQLTAIASGGTMPYSYIWNDVLSQTTSTASNLCAGPYNVTITDAAQCVYLGSGQVNVDSSVAIAEPVEDEWRLIVYPNPGTKYLVVRLIADAEYNSDLIILNTVGQVIHQKHNVGNLYKVNLEQLPRGTYFLQFANKDFVIQRKIVVF